MNFRFASSQNGHEFVLTGLKDSNQNVSIVVHIRQDFAQRQKKILKVAVIWGIDMFGPVLVALLTVVSLVTEARPVLKEASYSLVRAIPRTRAQVDLLHVMRHKKDDMQIAFWRAADKPGRHVDIWIYGNGNKLFNIFEKNRIEYKTHLQNLTTSDELKNISMKNIDNYDRMYHSLTEIYSELRRLTLAYGDIMTLKTIGKSYENRSLYAIKIDEKDSSTTKKPLMFVNCGIHGREWLAISSCMRLLRRIAFDRNYDKDIEFITKNYEIIIAPVLNPDGYHFTRTKNRYWRKSRSKTGDANCPGVDLNRNFNFRWGGKGSSVDICDETYSGRRPFSENESLALARYLYSRRHDLKAFLDVHTFGQLLMYPWGYTRQNSFHWKEQRALLGRISQLIDWATGSKYQYGPASAVLYETSGDSTDWAYGYLGIVHSYGIELRPKMNPRISLRGFKHPASEIIPSSRELFIAIREILKYIYRESNMKRS